jgi:hypothetical protein
VPMPPALVDAFCYAGCINTPRVLQLVEGRLWQTPLPEIDTLRTRWVVRVQTVSCQVLLLHDTLSILAQPAPLTHTPPTAPPGTSATCCCTQRRPCCRCVSSAARTSTST